MEDRHVDLEFLGAWAINSQKTSIAADTSYQTDWWTIDDNKIVGYVHYYKYSGGRWERLHTLYVTIEKKRVGLLRRKAIDIKIYTYDPWNNEIIPADTDDGSFLYVRVYKNGRTKLMHRTAQVPYLTG